MAPSTGESPATSRPLTWLAGLLLAAALAFHLTGALTAWTSSNLPGHEFRQSQTAITAMFIDRENNFSLAYPTPVLGKPWSIPLEFPLYQWAVVGTARVTGWPLVEAGRAVALAAFYLTLPAIALVLAQLGMGRAARWIALALVVACPLHVFYARSFLIETTALCLAWWFLAAFAKTLATRRLTWAGAAALLGTAAGTVKVTTFIVFGLVAAGGTLVVLYREWHAGAGAAGRGKQILRTAAWSLGVVALPLVATVLWTRFADGVKAQNPAAHFLISGNMGQFNFGFGAFDLRFKALTWTTIAAHCHRGILPWPAALVAFATLVFCGGRWRWHAWAALGAFVAAPIIFPMLYASHDYYFVASASFLALAAGLACGALLERPRLGWLGLAAAAAIVGLQARSYHEGYLQLQRNNFAGADDLSIQLQAVTDRDDVVVIAGRDWNSMLPYYAARRALMVRGGTEYDGKLTETSFAGLHGEPVGALVLTGAQRTNGGLLRLAAERLGIDPRAALLLPEATVFLPVARISRFFDNITPYQPDGRDVLTLPPLLGHWPEVKDRIVEVNELHPVQRQIFAAFTPMPVRFFSQHGAGAIRRGEVQLLNTHSVTQLWFPLRADSRRLRATFGMYPGCWADPAHATDGIELAVSLVFPVGPTKRIYSKALDPLHVAADRGDQSVAVDLPANSQATELLIEFLPGPQGGGAYDWAYLGPTTIE